jgi:integrase/recombinase XerD
MTHQQTGTVLQLVSTLEGNTETPMRAQTLRLVDRYVTGRLQAHTLMASSAKEIRGTLRRFAAYVPEVAKITRRKVQRWLEQLDVSPGTKRSYFTAVRGFCQWLVLEGHLERDPTLGIRPPKKPQYFPRALEPWEVAAVLTACKDQRERLIVMLMAQTAPRCIEVSRLTVADINVRRRQITYHGKGDRRRTVPLVADAERELRRYLAETDISHGPLFPSKWDPSKPISAGWVSELIGNVFRRSGIKARPRDGKTPHALRHTCLSDMVDGGGDVLDVQEAAGHADLGTSRVYLRHRRAERLRDVMEGRHYDGAQRASWADVG